MCAELGVVVCRCGCIVGRWAAGVGRVDLPPDAHPKGCYVIRLRKQIDSSGSERTQQAESA